MAKITRIKASDHKESKEPKKSEPKEIIEPKKPEKLKESKRKKEKKDKTKKPFILFRPFVALGRYIKNSWLELRQVRWPNRKATWKMVLAVVVYTFIFGAFLLLLDIIFDLIFSKLI